MTLLFAARGALFLAAVLALILARRAPAHRPVAVFLCGGVLANALRIALQRLIILPAVIDAGGDPARGIPPAAPLHGWARVAAHADHGVQFAWSAGLVMTVLWVFNEQKHCLACGHLKRLHNPDRGRQSDGMQIEIVHACRCWKTFYWLVPLWALIVPVIAWATFTAFFAATYPETRPLHRQGYLLAELLALAVGVVALASWMRQRAAGEPLGVTRRCVLYLLALDGLALFGPHLAPNFYAAWDKAAVVYCVMYMALIAAQGVSIWQYKTGS